MKSRRLAVLLVLLGATVAGALSTTDISYNGLLRIKDKVANSSSFTIGHRFHNVTTGSSTITATLPASVNGGFISDICKTDNGSGTVVITRAGGDVINGVLTTRTLTNQGNCDTVYDMASGIWLARGDGGGTAGTGNVVNTGASAVSQVPRYTSTSGTAIAPSSVTIDASGNEVIPGTLTVGTSGAGFSDYPEGTCAAGVAGNDRICADSVSHTLQLSNNAAALASIASRSGALVAGNCVKVAANGTDFVDNGSTCAGGGGSGTVTSVAAANGVETTTGSAITTTGTVRLNTADLTRVQLYEEFCEVIPDTSAGLFKLTNLVGAGSLNRAAGSLPNPCIATLISGATSGNATMAVLFDYGGNGVSMLGDHTGTVPWEMQWVFSLASTASIEARVGLMNASNSTPTPTDGIWVRFDTVSADTNFQFECRKASTSTVVDTTIAADTNFHRIRIWSTVANQINFDLFSNNGTLQKESLNACSTNAPTVNITAGVIASTATAATKTVNLDAFGYSRTLAR